MSLQFETIFSLLSPFTLKLRLVEGSVAGDSFVFFVYVFFAFAKSLAPQAKFFRSPLTVESV